MRAHSRLVAAAMLCIGFVDCANMAHGECNPPEPMELTTSRFEVQGATVYDKSTDLTWMRCSYGQQWIEGAGCSGDVTLLDWDSAMAMHASEDPAWRLPQRDELQSIVAHNCRKPAINDAVFPATPSVQYWTSTPSSPAYAWVVFFRSGIFFRRYLCYR